MEYIDLRSDTVTKPTPEMREAMAVLPAVLGPALTVLAEWNEKKKAYTKLSVARERDLTSVSR